MDRREGGWMSAGTAGDAVLRPLRTWLAIGLFFVVYFASRQVALTAGAPQAASWREALLDRGSFLVAVAVVVSLIIALARRLERSRLRRGAILVGWLGLVLLSSPLFAAVLSLVRALPHGFAHAHDGGITDSFAASLRVATSTYLVLAAILVIGDWGFRSYDTFVRERVAAARLAQEIEREQLAAVSMRLDPELVLGALASIRGRLAADPAAAEDLLLELSDLLRRMLEGDPEGRWSLREEVRFAAGYFHLALAGVPPSGDVPLVVERTDWEPEVPTFLPRPWLEAAVGLARRDGGSAHVASVRAEVLADRLALDLRLRCEKGTPLAMQSADYAAAFTMIRERLRARFRDFVRVEQLEQAAPVFAVRVSFPVSSEGETELPMTAGTAGEVVWKRA
jgi:hypothetical protein